VPLLSYCRRSPWQRFSWPIAMVKQRRLAGVSVVRRIGERHRGRRVVVACPRKQSSRKRSAGSIAVAIDAPSPRLVLVEPVATVTSAPGADTIPTTHALASKSPCLGRPADIVAPNLEAARPALRSILKRPNQLTDVGSVSRREQTGGPQLQFQTVIRAHEYSRRVGGSCCVPQDGSNLALGLGELKRVFSEPESPKRRKSRNCGDGLFQLPVAQRERILRTSEKAEVVSAPGKPEWVAHRAELRCIQRSRATELENALNWQPMPCSLLKAQVRARKLASSMLKAVAATASTKAAAAAKLQRCKAAKAGKTQTPHAEPQQRVPPKRGGVAASGPVRVVKLATKKRERGRRKRSS